MSRGVDALQIDEPLTQALRALAVEGFTIGTPSRLHARLEAMLAPGEVPKDAAKLVQVLARSAQTLADAGVVVQRHKMSGTRLVQVIAVTPQPVEVAPVVRLEDAPQRVRGARGERPVGVPEPGRRRGGMRFRGGRGSEPAPDGIPQWVWDSTR